MLSDPSSFGQTKPFFMGPSPDDPGVEPDKAEDLADREDGDAGMNLAVIIILSALGGLALISGLIGIGIALLGAHP